MTWVPILSTLKLKTKLQLSFLLIGLLAIAVTGWQAFESAREAIESITFDRLTSIRETKKRQIELYFQQVRNQVVALSEDRMAVDAMRGFVDAYRRIAREDRRILARSVAGSATETGGGVAAYRRMFERYHPLLESYRRRFGYDDLYLVDAESAQVVYSALRRPDFSTDLVSGPFRTTSIAEVFSRVRGASRTDTAALADFASYPASPTAPPVSFIAAPVMDDGRIRGVLIFQIPIALVNQVMTSANNWQAEGLGKTGETYIVGSDFTMRTDSRFYIQEPEEYFRRLRKTGTDETLIETIRLRRTSILLQEVRTSAAIEALRGQTNTTVVHDYRGIQVLSSYAPLHIPGVRWVILAEIDASEAFLPVLALRERLILLGLGILLLSAIVAVVIARTISGPILALAAATERFGKGDLAFRAEVATRDEIGMLAATFNSMAERTMLHTRELQSEVAERRRAEVELHLSQQRLRSLSAHLQTVREEERKGLAREIHDELGQALTLLKLHLSLLRNDLPPEDTRANATIGSMLTRIDGTIRSVKRMITALRPRLLDDLGLAAAIEWQAEEFQNRTGIRCGLTIVPEEIAVDPDRSTAIFRIFQETLTNVMRHAEATGVDVRLEDTGEEVELAVMDDGVGVREDQVNNQRSFGLIGIRERASYWGGTVIIEGRPNAGTRVIVRIPHRHEEHHD
ncbi:MAG: HAMP domain-containing protein [Bacteroidota bacterium]